MTSQADAGRPARPSRASILARARPARRAFGSLRVATTHPFHLPFCSLEAYPIYSSHIVARVSGADRWRMGCEWNSKEEDAGGR